MLLSQKSMPAFLCQSKVLWAPGLPNFTQAATNGLQEHSCDKLLLSQLGGQQKLHIYHKSKLDSLSLPVSNSIYFPNSQSVCTKQQIPFLVLFFPFNLVGHLILQSTAPSKVSFCYCDSPGAGVSS